MQQIHYFEEDYGQIEVVLMENIDYIRHKIEKIAKAIKSDEEISCDEPIYSPPLSELNLERIGISIDRFEKAMNGIRKFDKVFWGESEDYECPDVFAFGDSTKTVVFVEIVNQIVSKIWLTLDIYEEDDYIAAEKLLYTLSTFAELLIVDWGWQFFECLNNREKVLLYLQRRLLTFKKVKG